MQRHATHAYILSIQIDTLLHTYKTLLPLLTVRPLLAAYTVFHLLSMYLDTA
jgi:hypothetical protein